MKNVTRAPCRDIIGEIQDEMERHRDEIQRHAPCKITVHIPPLGGREKVVIELNTKLR